MSKTQFLIGRSGLDLQDDFYPDDLPSEWRFDYYSTLFKALSLPIDTDEDLEQIFEEIQDSKEDSEEFELILSIQNSQLTDVKQLSVLLATVADYQQQFILFCEVTEVPTKAVMKLLDGYRICFQSPKILKLGLKEVLVAGQYLSFNQHPVLYASQVWDEKQMRAYLEAVSGIKTKTILICQFAESETLNKIRIIAELLGY